MSFKEFASKVATKLLEVSGNRILNDALFVGVMWINTGDVYDVFTGLSSMKVVSTAAYLLYSEHCKWKPLKKALGWEAIISALGLFINGILTGDLGTAISITMMMKVAIVVNWAWFKLFDK